EGRIFPSYPHYLRRSAPVGRGSIVEKLAELAGTNKATTRDEFLHPLFMLSQDDSQLGDSTLFDISLNLGLTGEEHLSLAGLAKTRRSSKALLKDYEAAEEKHKDHLMALKQLDAEGREAQRREASYTPAHRDVAPDQHVEPAEQPEDDEPGPSPGQMTLF
ncbi:MAG: hypothetical protein VXA43_06070, partial [Candidatus Poseidoniales archaeon]